MRITTEVHIIILWKSCCLHLRGKRELKHTYRANKVPVAWLLKDFLAFVLLPKGQGSSYLLGTWMKTIFN